eukprot:g22723.t1
MEVGQSSASAQSPSPSFALEVRAALPLSATSGLQAAFSSGRGGTSNQLLQQLGQVIIQDILLLTLSQHTAGLSGIVGNTPSLPHLASSGLLNGATADASSALADLGGLLLQTLTTNGTLPVTLSAVETWGPGTSRDSPTHASNSVPKSEKIPEFVATPKAAAKERTEEALLGITELGIQTKQRNLPLPAVGTVGKGIRMMQRNLRLPATGKVDRGGRLKLRNHPPHQVVGQETGKFGCRC